MPSYYFDTSALAKRYVLEVGSSWVQAVIAQQNGQMIYTSVLTQPEIVSALQRRVREGILETYRAQHLVQQVLAHMTQSYALAAITPPAISQACALLQRHPLRAYDALHLACAMAVREVIERLSSLSSPNLVCGQNKVVLRTISIEAEANHLDRLATYNGRELERTRTLSGQPSAGMLSLASEIRHRA